MLFSRLLWICVVVVGVASAQQSLIPPSPLIETELLPQGTVVAGRASAVGVDQSSSVEIRIDGDSPALAENSIDSANGKFRMVLEDELRGGVKVEVRHVVGGVAGRWSPPVLVPIVRAVLSPTLREGSVMVAGNVEKVKRVTVAVFPAEGESAIQQKTAVVGPDGKFQARLAEPLQTEQVVVALVAGARSSPVRVSAKAEMRIRSAVGLIGSKKLTVYLESIPENVKNPAIEVRTPLESTKHDLNAAERKANKAEITLTRPLTIGQRPGEIEIKLMGDGGAASKCIFGDAQPNCRIQIVPASITLSPTIYEGAKKITGSTAAGVTKVVVRVYRGILPKRSEVVDIAKREAALKSLDPLDSGAEVSMEQSYPIEAALIHQAPSLDAGRERVKALIAGNRLHLLQVRQIEHATPDNGVFEVNFDEALNAGEWVAVRQVYEDTELGEQELAYGPRPVQVRSVLIDWGRLRAVFSLAGMANQDGEVKPYVNFFADARLTGGSLLRKSFSSGNAKAPCRPRTDQSKDTSRKVSKTDLCLTQEYPGIALRNFRYGVHGFLDARLTAAEQEEGDGDPGGDQADASRELIFSQADSALFQTGVYVPFSWPGADWVYEGSQYSWFVAPLVKAGWQTFGDGVLTRRTRRMASGAIVPEQASPTVVAQDMSSVLVDDQIDQGLMPFWGGGVRTGFFKYDLMGQITRNRQVSTDLVGYVDITLGKHRGYRTYANPIMDPNDDAVLDITDSALRRRIGLEARLKLPYIPAFIGVDGNLPAAIDDDRTPSDFRFLVGFRIDANKALTRVFGNVAQVK